MIRSPRVDFFGMSLQSGVRWREVVQMNCTVVVVVVVVVVAVIVMVCLMMH